MPEADLDVGIAAMLTGERERTAIIHGPRVHTGGIGSRSRR
jgi:hypothetical protein